MESAINVANFVIIANLNSLFPATPWSTDVMLVRVVQTNQKITFYHLMEWIA